VLEAALEVAPEAVLEAALEAAPEVAPRGCLSNGLPAQQRDGGACARCPTSPPAAGRRKRRARRRGRRSLARAPSLGVTAPANDDSDTGSACDRGWSQQRAWVGNGAEERPMDARVPGRLSRHPPRSGCPPRHGVVPFFIKPKI